MNPTAQQIKHNGRNTVICHKQAKKGTMSQSTIDEGKSGQDQSTTRKTSALVGSIIPDTPEAALVVAQAYLLSTQPKHGDPRESMHQDAIKGLGLIGDKLK
jgi:hypothetical protein